MTPSIIGESRVTRSADGRLYDNRNPNTILENGRARAAEVTNFIDGLTKVAKPLIDDALTKQANQQVGELLATQDPVQLIRSADPEQRSLIRQLSPQAQDILQEKAAVGSTRLYLETLQAERTKRAAILQSPTASPEEKAKAESDAKGTALDVSGLSKVSPSYLTKYSDVVIQGEATLKGLDYKETIKAQDANERTTYRGGLRSDINNLRAQRLAVVTRGGDVGSWAANVKDAFEKGIVKDSARYTPAEQAQLWAEAYREELTRLTAADQWDDAINLAQTLRGVAAMGVMTPAGVDFFSQKLQDGTSLAYLFDSSADSLDKGYREFQQRQVLEENKDVIRGAMAGNPEAEAGFQQALQNPSLTAEQMLTLGQSFSQADSIGSRPTDAQIQKEADLRYQIAQGGFQPDQMWAQVKASGLKPQQVLGLAGMIQNGATEGTQLVAGARQYLTQETVAAGSVVAQANGITDENQVSTITRDLQNAASRQAEQRIAQLQASGQQVNADKARDIFRNELEAIRNTRLKEAKADQSAYKDTPDRRVATELNQFQQNVRQSNGQVTVMSFPQPVRAGFQQAYPNRPMTTQALEKYMMSRMQQIKNAEGKPVYANPQQVLQGLIKEARGVDTTNAGSRYTDQIGGALGASPLGQLLQKAQEAVQGVQRMAQPKPASGSTPKPVQNQAKPKEQAKAPQQQSLISAVAQVGLNSLANVITPPAAAAERQPTSAIVNQNAIEILSKIWAKREPLRLTTPGLPQVPPTAPTAPTSLAIKNDMHPLFVAIGISEGTRTASGGYTQAYYGHRDPGNGVWNVGTVSGQQGGSPRSSDQRWMARLTQQASSAAPILRRMGLQPGTQGWNRIMFNILDLTVQAPAAAGDFIRKLPNVIRQGASIEAIAKARADSFINPATGRLDAGGFGNSYSRLFADQRSRAGVWDYRRRI